MGVFFSVLTPSVVSTAGLAVENAPVIAKAVKDASGSLGETSLDQMTSHLKTLAPAFAMREQKPESFVAAYTPPQKTDVASGRDIS